MDCNKYMCFCSENIFFAFRCAGICCYEGHGGLCSVRLSQPLLKLRPRRDLVETLLVKISTLVEFSRIYGCFSFGFIVKMVLIIDFVTCL